MSWRIVLVTTVSTPAGENIHKTLRSENWGQQILRDKNRQRIKMNQPTQGLLPLLPGHPNGIFIVVPLQLHCAAVQLYGRAETKHSLREATSTRRRQTAHCGLQHKYVSTYVP